MKKTGKILSIFLSLAAIVGIAWYFNKNYLSSFSTRETSSQVKVESPKNSSLQMTDQKILLASGSDVVEIQAKSNTPKVLFTDKNETQKFQKIGGVASGTQEIFATIGDEKDLVAIKVDGSGKKETLIKAFGTPDTFVPSPDGKMIASVVFSNAERDYGFTLNGMGRTGENQKALLENEEEIGNLTWNADGSKLYFSVTKGGSTEIQAMDFKSGSINTVYKTNAAISSVSFSREKILVSQGLDILDVTTGVSQKLFSTSVAIKSPQISKDNKNIIYLKNQDLYITDVNGKDEVKLATNVKIFSWN